ncbi:uncharacterized protein EV154DRAFT_414165 [Mucor mucedo]|uniref:uncharacterized protein n=1 Tax=Mucor mucedo TaxID=29922 RepID=UPI002220D696|nr:uncharacterized protein EV154DRAFT_414165 [Mucor mucedo]KAI7895090.1 hypothetical protein EV154DRAFT_414165 [Mucor mucedo]
MLGQAINIQPPTTSQAINIQPATTTVKKETKVAKPRVKKEPKAKAPKVKKEPKPKAVKAKKEPAPKTPKRKPAFKLPPEANIYMNDAMRSRVVRAMNQRMFVMSRELSQSDESVEKFEVLGSIGNNYTVTIGPTIKCSCMDYAIRRVHCKHILMILLKVYRLPYDNPIFRRLQTSAPERIEARTHARVVDPSVLVPREIREKILSITQRNHPQAASPSIDKTTERRPLDTSDCPVCFEEFEEAKIAEIDFCKTCGNNVHKECFQTWARSKGSNVSCVYCRAKWVKDTPAVAGPSKKSVRELDPAHINENYYANFADELGIERTRDTSTYKYRGSYPIRKWD